MDVRDVAAAYRMMLEKGRAGEAYNISTEHSVPVSGIFDLLCREAGVRPDLEVDPARYRPTDRQPVIRAAKLRADTGWSPRFTLEQTLADVYAWAASA
jgi:GDP-4-dehydro-6-deoxy-D-mannose reductase